MGRRKDFVVEGIVKVGPHDNFFALVDGHFLGRMFAEHAGVESKHNEYTRLGRARITVEWIEDDEVTEEASPT